MQQEKKEACVMITASLNVLGISPGRYNPAMLLDAGTSVPADLPEDTRTKIRAVREILRFHDTSKTVKPKVIRRSKDIHDLLMGRFAGLDHEELVAVFLRKDNSVTDIACISVGGLDSTTMDNRIIIREALTRNASGVVIAHNHPSGNCLPSRSDIENTTKLSKSLKIMDITFIDHIIFSKESYYSFAEEQTHQA